MILIKLFNSKTIIIVSFVFYCFCIVYSCAAIQSPSGGPKDDIPPVLLRSFPESEAVNFISKNVELFFSEYLLEKSIQGAITILPKISSPFKVQYKGKKLIVEFPDSLLNNQTYILSINRNLKDENGVSIAEGIQLAFSTGIDIDKSEISGRVFSKSESSVLLWKIKDSLDVKEFFKRESDYSIDSNDDGSFSFKYLSEGIYRIVGVDRTKSNSSLDSKSSIYGLPSLDIIKIDKTETRIKSVEILLPEYPKFAKTVSAKWVNNQKGEIIFDIPVNRNMDLIAVDIDIEGEKLQASTFNDHKKNNVIHFFLQDSIQSGIKTLINIYPKIYEGITHIDSAIISALTKPDQDTTYLSINNFAKIFDFEIEEEDVKPFDIYFSRNIYSQDIEDAFVLKRDSIPIDFNFNSFSPVFFQIIPKQNWVPLSNYSLSIYNDKLKLGKSRGLKDSVKVISFKTSDHKKFGSLIGDIIKPHPEPIIARLTSLENKSYTKDVFVNSNSSFKINKVPEGIYSLMFYLDLDNNNKYFFGQLSPYKPSEWFKSLSDTISIRSNWDMEINKINLNEI